MEELKLTKHQLGIILDELDNAIGENKNCVSREDTQWIKDIFRERAETLTELANLIKEIQITGSVTITNIGRK